MQRTIASSLETTNSLQSCLERWSVGKWCEEQVSDVYVAFGFNVTLVAFISLRIDLS